MRSIYFLVILFTTLMGHARLHQNPLALALNILEQSQNPMVQNEGQKIINEIQQKQYLVELKSCKEMGNYEGVTLNYTQPLTIYIADCLPPTKMAKVLIHERQHVLNINELIQGGFFLDFKQSMKYLDLSTNYSPLRVAAEEAQMIFIYISFLYFNEAKAHKKADLVSKEFSGSKPEDDISIKSHILATTAPKSKIKPSPLLLDYILNSTDLSWRELQTKLTSDPLLFNEFVTANQEALIINSL